MADDALAVTLGEHVRQQRDLAVPSRCLTFGIASYCKQRTGNRSFDLGPTFCIHLGAQWTVGSPSAAGGGASGLAPSARSTFHASSPLTHTPVLGTRPGISNSTRFTRSSASHAARVLSFSLAFHLPLQQPVPLPLAIRALPVVQPALRARHPAGGPAGWRAQRLRIAFPPPAPQRSRRRKQVARRRIRRANRPCCVKLGEISPLDRWVASYR